MKKYLFLLPFAFLTVTIRAQFRPDKDPFITKSFSESIKSVKAQTSGGSITVEGGSGAARIEVFVTPNNFNALGSISKEELQKRLDESYDLNISVENNTIVAIAKQKERNMNWKRAVSISYKIYVPQNVSTDLATSGGSISLSNLSGIQEFSTSGGSLRVEKLSGKITGHTSGGSIDVSDSKEEIDLTTSGGGIKASNCNGKIKLSTSGGSLSLANLKGDITATTSGGSVNGHDIDGDLAAHTSGGNISLQRLSCSLETSTSGGNIDVQLTDLKKFVKISNSAGNINLQVPNKAMDLKLTAGRIKTDKLNNFSGSVDEERIHGKLNGGGVPVTVDAGSGRITFSLN